MGCNCRKKTKGLKKTSNTKKVIRMANVPSHGVRVKK